MSQYKEFTEGGKVAEQMQTVLNSGRADRYRFDCLKVRFDGDTFSRGVTTYLNEIISPEWRVVHFQIIGKDEIAFLLERKEQP